MKKIIFAVLICFTVFVNVSCSEEEKVYVTDIQLSNSLDDTDTYTIYYSDGSTALFNVTNGEQGIQGIQGEAGEDGHTPIITIENGNWYVDGVDTLQAAQGVKGEVGNGISKIEKTKTQGLVDTYTIYYTNGSTTKFTIVNGSQGVQGIQGEKGDDGRVPVITIQNGNWYVDGVDTLQAAQGVKGDTGNGISKIEKTKTQGLVDTYTIYYTNGSTTKFTIVNGSQGVQGIQGEKGDAGRVPVITIQNGNWYVDGVDTLQAAQGVKGEVGNGISKIEKTKTQGLVDTYTIYYTNGSTTKFTIVNGMQGVQGVQGEPGKDGHTPVITIQNGNWYIDGVDTLQAAQGVKGDTGNGISKIEKTKTQGLVDTYTIYYTNGSTTKFTIVNGSQGIQGVQGEPGKDGYTPVITIQNGNWYIDGVDTLQPAQGVKGDTGNGINKIEKTGTDGLVDTYTIYYTNGTTTTFTITNGSQGEKGSGIVNIEKTGTDGLVDTYTIYFADGGTSTFTITNGNVGSTGKSAYELYLEYHPEYTKSEAEWLDDLANGNLGSPRMYTVEFDSNGGSEVEAVSVQHSFKISKPLDPVKNGYTFDGWYYEDTKWNFNIYGVLDNMKLVAKWKEATYVVEFETFGAEEVPSIEYKFGETKVLNSVSKEGYSFGGWYTSPEYLDEQRIDSITSSTFGSFKLYARFIPNKYYVTLIVDQEVFKVEQADYEQMYSLTPAVKTGHLFIGWFYQIEDIEIKYTDELGNSLSQYSHLFDITLYAKFSIETYVVSFNLDGKGEIEEQKIQYNETLVLPEAPVHDVYLFAGWFNEDFTVEYENEIVVTQNMVIYAKWIQSMAISTYEELVAIKDRPAQNFHLTNDINCDGNTWIPIDEYSGILNGFGYKIYNLTITRSASSAQYYGFIIKNMGTIKNLVIEGYVLNSTVSNVNGYIGVLTAVNTGVIDNCVLNKGTVSVSCSHSRTVNKQYGDNLAKINFNCGQIAGSNNGTIKNSVVQGDINIALTAQTIRTGGGTGTWTSYLYAYCANIAGVNGANAKIENCLSIGNINSTEKSVGKGYAYLYVGYGVAGVITGLGGVAGYSEGVITNTYSDVNVSTTASLSKNSEGYYYMINQIGAITGLMAAGKVTNSFGYLNGQVNGIESDIGGLIGKATAGEIKNCEAKTGYLINASSHTSVNFGGVVGNNSAKIQNCISKVDVTCNSGVARFGFICGINNASGIINSSIATGSASIVGGTYNTIICGLNNGSMNKVSVDDITKYYLNGSNISATMQSRQELYMTSIFVSKEYLIDELYWNDSIWYIDGENYPTLYQFKE